MKLFILLYSDSDPGCGNRTFVYGVYSDEMKAVEGLLHFVEERKKGWQEWKEAKYNPGFVGKLYYSYGDSMIEIEEVELDQYIEGGLM